MLTCNGRDRGDGVTGHKEAQETETGRIVAFRPRATPGKKLSAQPILHDLPLDDLQKYERDAEPDDYRRRMIVNALAFTFIVALTCAGIWLADQMALLRKQPDCAVSSSKTCADVQAIIRGR